MDAKLSEVEELVRRAEKSLKKSFLKWKPDIDSAVEFYGKAVIIYRNLKMHKETAEMQCLIARLNAENGSFFHSAKAYESASMIYRDMSDFDKMAECVESAGSILRQNGVPDTATSIYERAARSLENNLPEKSAEFYQNAADTSELEEKYLQAASCAEQSARIYTRLRRFSDAERLLNYVMRLCQSASANEPQTAYQICAKSAVALITIKLFQGDSVAASKVYNEAVGKYHFAETDDVGPVANLLQAYESMDSEAASRIIKLPTFRNLQTEFAKLALSIKFPSSEALRLTGDTQTTEAESLDIC